MKPLAFLSTCLVTFSLGLCFSAHAFKTPANYTTVSGGKYEALPDTDDLYFMEEKQHKKPDKFIKFKNSNAFHVGRFLARKEQ